LPISEQYLPEIIFWETKIEYTVKPSDECEPRALLLYNKRVRSYVNDEGFQFAVNHF
jgi:hypothetical protein